MIFVALILALVLFALIWRWTGRDPSAPRPPEKEEAANALRRRYARGEIDSAEFHRLLHEIDG